VTRALLFPEGTYHGGTFPITGGARTTLAQSRNPDMVLFDDAVSDRHARITVEQGELSIEDLGSTTGTFVNGARIHHARLKDGDVVRIGGSALEVIPHDGSSHDFPSGEREAGGSGMTGTTDEVPLGDLLALLEQMKKTGVLVLRTETDEGKIYLRDGLISSTSIDLARMSEWPNADFVFENESLPA